MKLKVFTIKLNDGKFIVNDYYNKELPSAKYENKAHAIELCRMRLGKSIHDELHQVKVPFTKICGSCGKKSVSNGKNGF